MTTKYPKIIWDNGIAYDDVLLQPQYSEVETRSQVYLGQTFLGYQINTPIISANMDYVTGRLMVKAMGEAGGFGILHRFAPWVEQLNWIGDLSIDSSFQSPIIPSFGVRDTNESLLRIKEIRPLVDAVCIDVAHAHSKKTLQLIEHVRNLPDLPIIAGNIATTEAFYSVAHLGVEAIKVGIGPGAVCTTRTVTGVGVPQLSAIMGLAAYRDEYFPNVKIIADGGIKNSGDIVKALAGGADFVMLGHLLAGHDECPGTPIEGANGRVYKPYRGQSIFGSNGLRYSPEGVSGFVEARGPVRETLKRLAGGIRSGLSYVGATNLKQLREKAVFIKVSHGSTIETATRVLMEI